MGIFFARQMTNPGPHEPDLGMDSTEVEDSDFTTSYMEVSYPLDVRVEPASPNSSWLNLVFNDRRYTSRSLNTETARSQAGIYAGKGETWPKTARLSSAARSATPLQSQLQIKAISMSPVCQGFMQNMSPEERQYRGVAIANTLQQWMTELVDSVNPVEAACCLYGVGIISNSERNVATVETVCIKQRSSQLMMNLISKLKENPHWFEDACKALENTGARSITDKVRAIVHKKWQEYSQFTQDVEETSKVKSTDSDIGEGTNSKHVEATDTGTMLPSSQLSELDLAYKRGGPDEARQLLQSQSTEENNRLLQDACKEGVDPTIVELLLSELPGCDVNGRDRHGRTCLHTACASLPKGKDAATCFRTEEQMEKMGKLLDGGADSRIQDEDGNTPLHIATNSGSLEITKMLLKHAPDLINVQNNERQTVLHMSTMNQLPALTAELVKCRSSDPCLCDKDERTPLHYACLSGMTDLVKPLLSKCHNMDFVNATDSNGDTGLHISAREGHKKVMKLLLKCSADVALKNNGGQTPLDVAKDRGNFKAVKVLLKKKYPIRWRLKLQKMNMKQSVSLTRLPTSASMNSVNSEAVSSVCSEINVTTSGIDLDDMDN